MEKLNDDELSQVFGGAIADKFDGIQEDSDDDDLILDLDTPIP